VWAAPVDAIGILGGTFDPVHNGHLRAALEFRDLAGLSEVRLIPVGTPPHRDHPRVEGAVRARMLRAAIEGLDGLRVDERELTRFGPSYTVDTLAELRKELPDKSLCLIIGMDQFAALDQWHEWRRIFDLAHVCVADRAMSDVRLSKPLEQLLASLAVEAPTQLHAQRSGHVFVGQMPRLDISSTRIRTLLAGGHDPRFLLPDSVLDIIGAEKIYDYQ
jgi:nicotinate-nucleotide adenylyltransferase